jgi:hypothetical protein
MTAPISAAHAYDGVDETRARRTASEAEIGIASAIWGVSIFLSRIMGLVREQIIGRTLGASRTSISRASRFRIF